MTSKYHRGSTVKVGACGGQETKRVLSQVQVSMALVGLWSSPQLPVRRWQLAEPPHQFSRLGVDATLVEMGQKGKS